MSCDLLSLATAGVAGLKPYQPGKPIEALQRELGLDDVIKLASNENPLGPSPRVLEAIAATKELSRYPDGGFDLKQALAAKHHVQPEQITLGNGSNDIFEMVTRAFVNTEHEVIYSQYSFAVYPIVTQAVGADHVVVAANDWGHDLAAMAAAVTDKTRLILIANPNNPTGTWSNKTDLKTLLEGVPEHVLVLIDEAYFDYAQSEQDYPHSDLWLSDFNNLIVTRTFSKAYGLAGLRIGYALSHPDVADLLNRVRQPFNNNSLALVSAIAALADHDYIKHSIEVNRLGMAQLIQGFERFDLTFISSKANFICVDFQHPVTALYQALLKTGIIVRPLADYNMPNHLRISVGQEFENARFINALESLISAGLEQC